MDYHWAVNKEKLQRAIVNVKEKNKVDASIKLDEETYKARYISMGGLLHEVSAEDEEEVVETKKKKVQKKDTEDDEDENDK